MKIYTTQKLEVLKMSVLGTIIGTVFGYYAGFSQGKKYAQQSENPVKKEIKMTELPSCFQNKDTLTVIMQNYNIREK